MSFKGGGQKVLRRTEQKKALSFRDRENKSSQASVQLSRNSTSRLQMQSSDYCLTVSPDTPSAERGFHFVVAGNQRGGEREGVSSNWLRWAAISLSALQ